MSRRNPLEVVALEAREVPAAGAFADIMPGIWGSYPHDFAASGNTLYFAADNGHGDEVYASDGTAAGTKMVKDLSPTARGSAPKDIVGVGNGVAFFTADDGTGRALYRTDGTAAGTAKVPGVPADAKFVYGGVGGRLFFTTPNGAGRDLYGTDGTAPVKLANSPWDFAAYQNVNGLPGRAYFQAVPYNLDNEFDFTALSSDGTAAGTFAVPGQVRFGGQWNDTPVTELAPGKWLVLHSVTNHDNINRLAVRDATGAERVLFDFEPRRDPVSGWSFDSVRLAFGPTGTVPLINGKVFFTVTGGLYAGLWTTDGTPEGTKKAVAGGSDFAPLAAQGSGVLVTSGDGAGGVTYTLTDGTAAKTAPVLTPDGRPLGTPLLSLGSFSDSYLGHLPASAGTPDGLLVFRVQDKVFVTDGTPTGAKWIDATGLPADRAKKSLPNSSPFNNEPGKSAVLNGSLYFAGPRVGDVRPEPWKWTIRPAAATPPVTPPPVPPVVPPKVGPPQVLADIRPGSAGSAPHDLIASGSKLYFAADNGQGEEVYVSDGTAAGTRIVKDLNPGKNGSSPVDFVSAGNAVAYFTANDGAGFALYRTDGTAAGTAKVPGAPSGLGVAERGSAVGLNGSLYYSVRQGGSSRFYRTDGGQPVLLGTVRGDIDTVEIRNGRVSFRATENGPNAPFPVPFTLWETDGSAAGTRAVLPQESVTGPGGQTAFLRPEGQLPAGRWLMYAQYPDKTTQFWLRDAAGKLTLLKTFAPVFESWGMTPGYRPSTSGATLIDGGALFFVSGEGLYRTDGTPAGTRPAGQLVGPNSSASGPTNVFAGRAVVPVTVTVENTFGQTTLMSTVLTDGTAAGSTTVLGPDGDAAGNYLGQLPPDAANPKGLLLFGAWHDGANAVFATDGTLGNARWIDSTGLPEGGFGKLRSIGLPSYYSNRDGGALIGRDFYFAGSNATAGAEPWKWTLAPKPDAASAPKVASVVVNGGAAQRSVVTRLDITFDGPVQLAEGAISVVNLAGSATPVRVTTTLVGGKTVATVTFDTPNGSLDDGNYSVVVRADKATAGGVAMNANSVTPIHRLFGDLDGDRTYDRASRWMLHERLGTTRGQMNYLAEFDFDGNGVIDAVDEVAVVRHWGKSI